ncbi:MAG: hypothetical protein R3213_10300, partial [Flavobacteriaceae bacterium]|nr:hypothetical protein [Flavobacteriaceae bacterium]
WFIDNINIKAFNELPESMQWGVLVDFFDSVGIKIYEQFNEINGGVGHRIYEPIPDSYKSKRIGEAVMLTKTTRHEARKAAIEKANQIFNERN